jgi:hypothetical protein
MVVTAKFFAGTEKSRKRIAVESILHHLDDVPLVGPAMEPHRRDLLPSYDIIDVSSCTSSTTLVSQKTNWCKCVEKTILHGCRRSGPGHNAGATVLTGFAVKRFRQGAHFLTRTAVNEEKVTSRMPYREASCLEDINPH